ncbi:unnamed protein product [Dimorphilus gyrociliatus]|uniref:glycerophosphodiester phosphodiesterase n=1 Tax=Dimorphilus gyrociliatus TaxID=2664684 RepID=A0A7I8VZL6_9ANNE|nr:unnamed protein product [Dimorphilus gyrociliatus]
MKLAVLLLFVLDFSNIINTLTDLPVFNHGLPGISVKTPLNIAHRGASGERPDHTEVSYKLAIEQGAHFIECDICLSKDLVPVCHHDCYLNATTDVHSYPEFHNKSNYHDIPGLGFPARDYYTVDFTWQELRRLKIKRKSSSGRNPNYNLRYRFLSLEDYISIAQNASRTIGIYPELKASAWHNEVLKDELLNSQNTSFEKIVVKILHDHGYDGEKRPCYLQSFEEETAEELSKLTKIPVIFLTPLPLITDFFLDSLSKYAAGVGVTKAAVFFGGGSKISTGESTGLVKRVHDKNMKVHVWTFTVEDRSIPWIYGDDVRRQYDAYIKEKVDGLFTDYPYGLREHLDYRYKKDEEVKCEGNSLSLHFLSSFLSIWLINKVLY